MKEMNVLLRSFPILLVLLALPSPLAVAQQPPVKKSDCRPRFRIARGDLLHIKILNHPEIPPLELRVDNRGMIRMPDIGLIQAEDQTPGELAREIMMRGQAHLSYPRVDLFIKRYVGCPVDQPRPRDRPIMIGPILPYLSARGGVRGGATQSVR